MTRLDGPDMANAQASVHNRYHLRIADIAGRRLGVVQTVTRLDGDRLRLSLPNWVPGSYLIREFASNVVRVDAYADGVELPCTKEDKSTWCVDLRGARECEIRYEVYAGEASVRTSYVSHDQAFVNPGGTFLCPVGREHEPIALSIELPAGWRCFTALSAGAKSNQFLASDYDRLVDCPIQLGPLTSLRFDVDGVPHDLVVVGSGNLDVQRALVDTANICRYEKQLFGELPVERYLFILLLTDDRGGGLEHVDSSVLAWPKLKFRPEKEYRKFLSLVAHEYFHLWNVKRIQPQAFARFDYSREVYTRLLWVFEGITSYYDQLVPMRAGVYSPANYFELLAERIVAENSRGGRLHQSISDSSFDTWIKLYRPTPDSYNSQVSYYERGEIVALLLDLHLRACTKNRKSLDDVMRALYHDVYKRGQFLAEDGFDKIVLASTGVDVTTFLSNYVDGRGPLDLTEALAGVGLELSPDIEADLKDAAWIGATIDTSQGASKLANVTATGSAHLGGLMSGDEIIALDGHRVRNDLVERLKLYKTGECVRWTAFRNDRSVEGEMVFLPDPNPKQKLQPRKLANAAQKAAFVAWTGAAWENAFVAGQAEKA